MLSGLLKIILHNKRCTYQVYIKSIIISVFEQSLKEKNKIEMLTKVKN